MKSEPSNLDSLMQEFVRIGLKMSTTSMHVVAFTISGSHFLPSNIS